MNIDNLNQEQMIMDLCMEEFVLSKSDRKPIGFCNKYYIIILIYNIFVFHIIFSC
jgi:hypothetical protein